MTGIRCPGCGRSYRATWEILQAGGSVYSLGLAIKARCGCGQPLGSVSKIWRRDDSRSSDRAGNHKPG